MSQGGEEKGDKHGAGARELVRIDGRRIDVPQKEVMHGLVPLAGELVPGRRIPLCRGLRQHLTERMGRTRYPILIKLAIGETEGRA